MLGIMKINEKLENVKCNTNLNAGTSVIVHGQSFGRTFSLIVAASNTCNHRCQ